MRDNFASEYNIEMILDYTLGSFRFNREGRVGILIVPFYYVSTISGIDETKARSTSRGSDSLLLLELIEGKQN